MVDEKWAEITDDINSLGEDRCKFSADQVQKWIDMKSKSSNVRTEMGIYRDNLSAIVIDDNLSPIIVVAHNIFNLLITDIAFVI